MSDRVVVAPDAWVAPKAILDGEVHIGSGCVIDHGSMIVATGGRIDIGARVVILVSVIAQAYLAGVSARRVERLVQTLGIERLSKSQVSVMAKALDGMVDEFRNRPLDGGPYTYIWVDALTQRCRDGGRVANICTAIATAVNTNGQREILGVDVFTTEDGAAWTSFLRGLVARGLSGVRMVISDHHLGLRQAIAAVLPGAGWQRC